MNDLTQTVCAFCGGTNRIPREKLPRAEEARCGRCQAPLLSRRPESVAEAIFDAFVRRGDLPIVVDFWAPWCGPCQGFAAVLERAAARLFPEIRVAKVNIDEAPSLAARLNVRAVPTLAVFARGKEIARTSGVMDETALVQWVRNASR